MVGEVVGEMVGEGVEEVVGEVVGEAVGEVVGEAVGEAVGEVVGVKRLAVGVGVWHKSGVERPDENCTSLWIKFCCTLFEHLGSVDKAHSHTLSSAIFESCSFRITKAFKSPTCFFADVRTSQSVIDLPSAADLTSSEVIK